MINSEEFWSKSIEDEVQTIEILGVAKFGNLQISQVANFRNLRNFVGCQFLQPANTAHTCTYYLLFDPLVGDFIQVCPYVILIL